MTRVTRSDWGETVVALLALGLAIGATASMLTVAWQILLKPLPVPDADRLYLLRGLPFPEDAPTAWWSQFQATEGLSILSSGRLGLEDKYLSEHVAGAAVSASFFAVLRTQPLLGRAFSQPDEVERRRVALVSYGFWKSHFAGLGSVLGASLRVEGVPFQVIGVMPRRFNFPGATQLWVLRSAANDLQMGQRPGDAPEFNLPGWIARVRPGRTRAELVAEANAELNYLNGTFSPRSHVNYGEWVSVYPLADLVAGNAKPLLAGMSIAAALLMFVVVINCAALFFHHLLRCQRDNAVRAALGAPRHVLLYQLLGRAVVMGWASGAIGVIAGLVMIGQLRRSALEAYSTQLEGGPGLGVTLFACCFGMATIAGMLSGIWPAIKFARQDPNPLLQGRASLLGPSGGSFTRKALVAAEVALATCALTIAALAVRSAAMRAHVKTGISARDVLTADADFSAPAGKTAIPPLQNAVLDRLADGRMAEDVALSNALPLIDSAESKLYVWVGNASTGVPVFTVSEAYFGSLRIPLIAGRVFTRGDRESVIVNHTMAEKLWRGASPIGSPLRIDGEPAPRQIVGVVADVKARTPGDEPEPQMYLPLANPYRSQPVSRLRLLVRCRGACSSARSLPEQIRAGFAGVRVYDWFAYDDLLRSAAGPVETRALLLAAFAFCAWLIACCGVFALTSYSAASRTFEMGVCGAMGAGPADITVALMGESLASAAIGAVAGSGLGLLLSRFASGFIFGISPFDPASYVAAVCILLVGAMLGSFIPSVRISRLEPAQALRTKAA